MSNIAPEDAEGVIWDAVVIGTGAGGGAAGFGLARRGRSVLFLERGKVLHRDPGVLKGAPAPRSATGDQLLAYGRYPEYIKASRTTHGAPGDFLPGCGTGGSTAIFSMTMDRFRPVDFVPGSYVPRATGSSAPTAWPISYEEMAPFYDEAERLFRVRGTPDPLSHEMSPFLLNPPAATAAENALTGTLRAAGLNPYRTHSACEHLKDCSGCVGHLCPRECRNDVGRICVLPAIDCYGAHILSECTVLRLEEQARTVTHAVCLANRRPTAIRGRIFILAANAFYTPALLSRSANSRFREGLGNTSRLVGCNLMVHISDFLLAIPLHEPEPVKARLSHGLSFNDFYLRGDRKLGNIHVHPDEQLVFATILEDLPYEWNRVIADPRSGVMYEYVYPRELYERNRMFVSAFLRALRFHLHFRPLRRVGMLNLTHACGTCRCGSDPRTSVVDSLCRMHDLDNLYILDSSWFPSSGGINPSLTIVANSLRVASTL